MSIRRRTLLEMLLENYQTVSFDNVYHSLINVGKNKGKLKLSKISGNGVIENQWVVNGNFENNTGINIIEPSYLGYSVANNVLTLTLLNNIQSGTNATLTTNENLILNHKFLIKCYIKSKVGNNTIRFGLHPSDNNYVQESINEGQTKLIYGIVTNEHTTSSIYFRIIGPASSGQSVEITKCQCIDLTQRYGPGNEPTALTDNRIQAILNRGYIPFNEGTYKCSSVGLIETEPYNLFDGVFKQGDPYASQLNVISSLHNIAVQGGVSYTLEGTLPNDVSVRGIRQFDENLNQLEFSTLPLLPASLTLQQKTKYINIQFNNSSGNISPNNVSNVCFHRTGTRTGYAQHQSYLPSLYQEVEYIESSGTQYIETGVQLNGSTFSTTHYKVINESAYLGNGAELVNVVYYFMGVSGGKYYAGIGTNFSTSSVNNDNQKHTFELDNFDKTLKVDGQTILTFGNNASNISGTLNINLFRVSNTDPNYYYVSSKLYSSKIYVNDTLIRNFVPCYRKSDSVIGLYDLVNGVFYTNSGTGVFTKGNDVNHINNEITIPAILDLNGAINSHNTFEVLSDSYRFTRNVWYYTFNGSESWTLEGSYNKYYASMDSSVPYAKGVASDTLGNLNCDGFTTDAQTELSTGRSDKAVAIGVNESTRTICVRDNANITTPRIAQSYMTGKTVHYELATPQTISIPKKHLGVVDLGSLDYSKDSDFAGIFSTSQLASLIKKVRGNPFYCSIYTNSGEVSFANMPDMTAQIFGNGHIFFKNNKMYSSGSATDFKTTMAGQYLFYETQDEVADFNIKALCEKGGAINTSMFSWVENQQVNANGLYTQVTRGITFTKDVNNQTITLDGTCDTAFSDNSLWTEDTLTANHVGLYRLTLVSGSITLNGGTYSLFQRYPSSTLTCPTTANNSVYALIPSANSNRRISLSCSVGVEFTDATFKLETIDLTLGFGAGKEPTSINDPRIQKIIEMGYIPTNTSGTVKNVKNDVLCDLDVKIQN